MTRHIIMGTSRLEAFSDGVLAIIITIMVLSLPVPDEPTLGALAGAVGGGFLGYLLSFAYVGLYWNNHHHLFRMAEGVTGGVLWANLHLLFWLSLLPWATAWLGEAGAAPVPLVAYGAVLLLAATVYLLLQTLVVRAEGEGSRLRRAIGRDWKGKASLALYAAGIACGALAGAAPALGAASVACYAAVAALWMVPDRRIERGLA